ARIYRPFCHNIYHEQIIMMGLLWRAWSTVASTHMSAKQCSHVAPQARHREWKNTNTQGNKNRARAGISLFFLLFLIKFDIIIHVLGEVRWVYASTTSIAALGERGPKAAAKTNGRGGGTSILTNGQNDNTSSPKQELTSLSYNMQLFPDYLRPKSVLGMDRLALFFDVYLRNYYETKQHQEQERPLRVVVNDVESGEVGVATSQGNVGVAPSAAASLSLRGNLPDRATLEARAPKQAFDIAHFQEIWAFRWDAATAHAFEKRLLREKHFKWCSP
ncbi:unnamed protein product, partial [Amoebophrya sp. A25]